MNIVGHQRENIIYNLGQYDFKRIEKNNIVIAIHEDDKMSEARGEKRRGLSHDKQGIMLR